MANPQGGGLEKPASTVSRGGFGFRGGVNGGGSSPSEAGGAGIPSPGVQRSKESSRSPNPSRRGFGPPRPKSKTRAAPFGTSPSTSLQLQQQQQLQPRVIPCASVESLNDNESSPVLDNQTKRFGFRGPANSNNGNGGSNNAYLNNNLNNNGSSRSTSTPNNDSPAALIETPSTSGLVTASATSTSSSKQKAIPPATRGKSRLLGPGAFSKSQTGASPSFSSDNKSSNKSDGNSGNASASAASADNFHFPPSSPKLRTKSVTVNPAAASSKAGKGQGSSIGKMKNSGFGFRYDGIKSRLMPPGSATSRSATPSIKSPNEKIRKDLISKVGGGGGGGSGEGSSKDVEAEQENAASVQVQENRPEPKHQQQRRLSISPTDRDSRGFGSISSRPGSQPPSVQSSRRAVGANHFSVDGLNFIDASSSETFVSVQSSDPGSPLKVAPIKSLQRKAPVFTFNNNFMEDKEKVDKALSEAMDSEKRDEEKDEQIDEDRKTEQNKCEDPVMVSPLKMKEIKAVKSASTSSVKVVAVEAVVTIDPKDVISISDDGNHGDVQDDDNHDSVKQEEDKDVDIEIVDPDSPIPKTNLNLSLQSYSLEEDVVETPLAAPAENSSFAAVAAASEARPESGAPVAVLESSFVESVSSRTASPNKAAKQRINLKLDDLLRIEPGATTPSKDEQAHFIAAASSSETDDTVDLGKGSSVEEEAFLPLHSRKQQQHSNPQQHPLSSVSDSDFVESESVENEEKNEHPLTTGEEPSSKIQRKSSEDAFAQHLADADQISVASRSSNNIQELPDVETMSSCSIDSNDLMLDVDHSIDDIDYVASRKDSLPPSHRRPSSSQRWTRNSESEFGGESIEGLETSIKSSLKPHQQQQQQQLPTPGDLMTYNEEGGGDGHVLDGLDDIKEELDLLQKSLDLSASSANTASCSPMKKSSVSSHQKPSNGGLMDSHPSIWSSSKVSLSKNEDKGGVDDAESEAVVDRRSSASPVLKGRCVSVTEFGRTASPLGSGSGRVAGGRSMSAAASASPRHFSGVGVVTPKLKPPRTLPVEAEMEGMAFLLDGVTYRRSLQDVISMKTMLLKLKRILQQDEFTTAVS